MKQFLSFNKVGTYGGTNAVPATASGALSPEMLGAGLIALYGIDKATGKLDLLTTNAEFNAIKEFVIAKGAPIGADPAASGAVLSDVINRATVSFVKYADAAGAAKVMTLTGTGASPATVAGVAGVTIIDTSPNIISDWKSKTYEVKVNVGDTNTVVATALKAKIDADKNAIVTVAAGTGVLTLTAKKVGVTFDAHGTEGSVCENAVKAVTVQPVKPIGSLTGVQALELDTFGHEGGTRRGDGQLGDILPMSHIASGDAPFTIYMVTQERSVNRQGTPVDNKATRFLRTYLAIPTANAAMITAFNAIIAAAMVAAPASIEEEEEVGADAREKVPADKGKDAPKDNKRS